MKYYITADIHGFYTEFHKTLDEARYFTDPEPHKLTLSGDVSDLRGGSRGDAALPSPAHGEGSRDPSPRES